MANATQPAANTQDRDPKPLERELKMPMIHKPQTIAKPVPKPEKKEPERIRLEEIPTKSIATNSD